MPSDYDKQEQKHQAIASQLGIQWPQLAGALGLNADDVWKIQKQSDGGNPGEQSSAMLQMWLDRNGVKATDEQLSAGLKGIGREDLCYLLEDPVSHYGAVDPSLHMDKHMHYDNSGFNALSAELGSPNPTPGHISSPYPFTGGANRIHISTSTPVPALKAENETVNIDTPIITPSTTGPDEDDDYNKPHFIYVSDDEDSVVNNSVHEEKQNTDIDNQSSLLESEDVAATSRRSSSASSSTTSGEHSMVEAPVTNGEKREENEVEVPEVNEQTTEHQEDDVANGNDGVEVTTTIIRTIVVETNSPEKVELPSPKIEGENVVKISRDVHQEVVNNDVNSSSSDEE